MIAAVPIPAALAVGARPGLFKKGSQKNKVVHSGRGIMKGRGVVELTLMEYRWIFQM
jgi:hypothetical protein